MPIYPVYPVLWCCGPSQQGQDDIRTLTSNDTNANASTTKVQRQKGIIQPMKKKIQTRARIKERSSAETDIKIHIPHPPPFLALAIEKKTPRYNA